MERELTSVHHAMAEAAAEAKPKEEAMVHYSFRAREESLATAKEICERHGTTLSAYLRKCVELLPKDFMP